jgi:hypothetical protein
MNMNMTTTTPTCSTSTTACLTACTRSSLCVGCVWTTRTRSYRDMSEAVWYGKGQSGHITTATTFSITTATTCSTTTTTTCSPEIQIDFETCSHEHGHDYYYTYVLDYYYCMFDCVHSYLVARSSLCVGCVCGLRMRGHITTTATTCST